jgi:hypothetical protein
MRGLLSAIVVVLLMAAAGASGAKRHRCPGGRFIPEAALVTSSATTDAIVIDDKNRQITIGTACGPSKVKLKATRKGTVVRGSFRACAALGRRGRLHATIQPDCDHMAGTLRVAKGSPRLRSFSARRAAGCGDGLIDALMGEQCEGDGDCPGGLLCAGCRCATTTSTTSTPTSTSTSTSTSTTMPCSIDAQCPASAHCRAGFCRRRRPCSNSDPSIGRTACLEREACVGNVCECAGDCNLDGIVFSTEVNTAASISVGTANLNVCPAADEDGNGSVSGSEVSAAVNNLSPGCALASQP